MASMTLRQARDLVITLYYAATGKHDIDDRQLNVIIDTINRKYWMQAVQGLGSLMAVDSPDITSTSSGEYDYSGTNLDANGVYQLLSVEVKFQGRYLHLDYEIPQDRYQYNIAWGQVQALIPSGYTLLGETVKLLPRVSGAQTLRLTYIAGLADLSTDSQVLMNGKLPMFHQLVAYETAAILAPKDSDRSIPLAAKEMKEAFTDYLQSRQRQDGRKIRNVPWY